jgi:DNA-binding response OmpR family regulator
MTAYTTIHFESERQRALDLGAADFLKKPFDLNEAAAAVAKHVKG